MNEISILYLYKLCTVNESLVPGLSLEIYLVNVKCLPACDSKLILNLIMLDQSGIN